MIITLAEAVMKRKAELRGEPEKPECKTAVEVLLIKDRILEELGIKLPASALACVSRALYSCGYHFSIEFPGEGIVLLGRILYIHDDILCTSRPLATDPLWRARRTGEESEELECFDDFIDAVLYARGEATVDESGTLELRL